MEQGVAGFCEWRLFTVKAENWTSSGRVSPTGRGAGRRRPSAVATGVSAWVAGCFSRVAAAWM